MNLFDGAKRWILKHFGDGDEECVVETSRNLVSLGDGEFLTETNVFEGTQIFGATGSGKTSGSGQALAIGLLKAGFGGLVLTAKKDEVDNWRQYLSEAERSESLVVFEPGGDYIFNFLEYEARVAESHGISLTENLVSVFCAVMEVSQRSSGQGSQDAYWLRTLRQLLRNAIDLLLISGRTLSYQNIYEIVISAPTDPRYVVGDEWEHWRTDSHCFQAAREALARVKEGEPRFNDLSVTVNYWLKEYPNLAAETRSVVVSYFTSVADCFLRGALRDLFSPADTNSKVNLTPEVTHEGKVVVINIPVKEFNELGQFAQVLYKFIWQRATERRNPKKEGQRPVFLWADESQYFVSSHDMLFQTTARSSRAATVYLTQNISNYYALLPGEKGKAETDSLLGNFQTKIFHANGDSVTNTWAAELIGKEWDFRENHSSSVGSRNSGNEGSAQVSSSFSQTLDYQVLPMQFSTLKKGGFDNQQIVEAYIFQGGRVWSNGKNYKGVQFKQKAL
jgi:hypothetical protein